MVYSSAGVAAEPWPALPLAAWQPTYDTLHLWTQIVGKVKLELCPFVNEWWHVALHVTPRGLTTSTIPVGDCIVAVDFDFVDHNLVIRVSDGQVKAMPLIPRSVADFYREFMTTLRALGVEVRITTNPVECDIETPFDLDEEHAAYDAVYVERWWRIMTRVYQVFERDRARFVGKASPVQFFWGAFDLNATRFSGRPAPRHPGPRFVRLAEDQENAAAGFWPGGGALDAPAFYAYICPEPPGYRDAELRPDAAYYDDALGEFILPYDAVRGSAAPEQAILAFLESSDAAAAGLARWDDALLRPAGTVWSQ